MRAWSSRSLGALARRCTVLDVVRMVNAGRGQCIVDNRYIYIYTCVSLLEPHAGLTRDTDVHEVCQGRWNSSSTGPCMRGD